jgi:hypothetical protein
MENHHDRIITAITTHKHLGDIEIGRKPKT